MAAYQGVIFSPLFFFFRVLLWIQSSSLPMKKKFLSVKDLWEGYSFVGVKTGATKPIFDLGVGWIRVLCIHVKLMASIYVYIVCLYSCQSVYLISIGWPHVVFVVLEDPEILFFSKKWEGRQYAWPRRPPLCYSFTHLFRLLDSMAFFFFNSMEYHLINKSADSFGPFWWCHVPGWRKKNWKNVEFQILFRFFLLWIEFILTLFE